MGSGLGPFRCGGGRVLSWNMKNSEVKVGVDLDSNEYKDGVGAFGNLEGECKEGLSVFLWAS